MCHMELSGLTPTYRSNKEAFGPAQATKQVSLRSSNVILMIVWAVPLDQRECTRRRDPQSKVLIPGCRHDLDSDIYHTCR